MRPNLHPNATVNPYSTLFRDVREVVDTMNRLSQSDTRPSDAAVAASSGMRQATGPRTVKLPVDAWMDENAYTVRAFMPGVNPEEVEIFVEDDELTIRGNFPAFRPEGAAAQNEEDGQSGPVLVKRELFTGAFERRLTFRLPIDADAIEADYQQGVLTLRVPKAQNVKPRQIRVTAK